MPQTSINVAPVAGQKRRRVSWLIANKWASKLKDENDRVYWRCDYQIGQGICGHKNYTDKKSSSKNMINHMEARHSVTEFTGVQGAIVAPRGAHTLDAYVRPAAPHTPFTKEQFYCCVIDDLIATHAPYTAVERPSLQKLLYLAHSAPSLQHLSLPSDSTIKRYMTSYYDEVKAQIASVVVSLPYIAYTADGWTTSNMAHSFLGITAHWIDEEWRFRSLVLGFEPLTGSHTGANLADTMERVLKDFDLLKKPFFLTTDNASNMKTMARELEKKVGFAVFSATDNHIPCIGHVINLVVQEAIVKGLKAEAPEAEEDLEEEVEVAYEC